MKNFKVRYDSLILFILFFLLIPVVGFRLLGKDIDFDNYYYVIKNPDQFNLTTKEISFKFLLYLNDIFSSNSVYPILITYAIIGLGIKFYAILKYSMIPGLSLIIYFLSYFLLHEYTQIRAGISSGIFLLALPNIADGNMKSYFKKVIIACLFHWTAIILFPMYFFLRKIHLKYFLVLPCLSLAIYFSKIDLEGILLSQIQKIPLLYLYYQSNSGHQESINVLNLINLGFLLLFVFSVFSHLIGPLIKTSMEVVLIKVFSLSLTIFYLFAILNKPVIAFRLFEYLNVSLVFLIPIIVEKYRQKYAIATITISFFLVYFYHLIVNVQIIPFK